MKPKLLDQFEVAELARVFGEREAASPEAFPAQNLADLTERGLLGGALPVTLGGKSWRLEDAVARIEAVSAFSPSTALIWSMPLGLSGVLTAARQVAPEAHRSTFVDQTEWAAAEYRAGSIFAACNSEKGAGGSLAATKTVAALSDGAWRLDGEKILASGGSYAAWFFSSAKVSQDDLPGAGVVEFFLVPVKGQGVEVLSDWDGFGMRPTESHTVRYTGAPAREMLGFPNFIEVVQPLQYWYCLFAAIPLGCARGIIRSLGSPAPQSAALRLRLNEALARYEALHAYLLDTASRWRPAGGTQSAQRVLRTKTHVTQEATRLCAELFALSGGRHYRRTSPVARLLADSFAGTALRPPLPLALEVLSEDFAFGEP